MKEGRKIGREKGRREKKEGKERERERKGKPSPILDTPLQPYQFD